MKVNPVGKLLSEVEWAYLAGFLDGDGAIMATIEKHREKRYGFRVRVEIKITQYHQKDVVWLVHQTGTGYVRHSVRAYEWIVRDQKAASWILQNILPYIRGKRQQVQIALKILNYTINKLPDLQQVAHLADTLSSFNVRSKLRRKNYAIMIQESNSRND